MIQIFLDKESRFLKFTLSAEKDIYAFLIFFSRIICLTILEDLLTDFEENKKGLLLIKVLLKFKWEKE